MGAKELTYGNIEKLLKSLEEQGCRIRETKKGWFVYFPSGDSTIYHKTPSDHRAMKNNRARVRRNGLHWPFDPKE